MPSNIEIDALRAGTATNDLIAKHVTCLERTPDDDGWFVKYRGVEIPSRAPRYSEDYNSAAQMEKEMWERDPALFQSYVLELCKLFYIHSLTEEPLMCWGDLTRLIRAEPLDRCKAALKAALSLAAQRTEAGND